MIKRIETYTYKNFRNMITDVLNTLCVRRDTLAYIEGVLVSNIRMNDGIIVDDSIVLHFAAARENPRFETFQRIGDSVLWNAIVLPFSLEGHRDASYNIGRIAYGTCYKMLRDGSWVLYEELADRLPEITCQAARALVSLGN